MRAVLGVLAAASLVAALSGCDDTTMSRGPDEGAASSSGSAASPETSPEGEPFQVPTAVAAGRLCGGLDEATVSDLLGATVTRRDVVRPGDPVVGQDGLRVAYYRCDFGTERKGDEARGVAVSWTPRSGGTAGDSRRALEAGESFTDAGCDVDDLPDVDTERGYVETCTGLDERRPDDGSGPYVAPGTAVRVDVGRGHLYCFEYSPFADPSGIAQDDVVAACQTLFSDLAR